MSGLNMQDLGLALCTGLPLLVLWYYNNIIKTSTPPTISKKHFILHE